jgi:hypothetical protein
MDEIAAALIAVNFVAYPGLGDRNIASPPPANAQPRIEATIDKGPIVEIIIRCRDGSAIISYSKIERLYCSPRMRCVKSLEATVTETCR